MMKPSSFHNYKRQPHIIHNTERKKKPVKDWIIPLLVITIILTTASMFLIRHYLRRSQIRVINLLHDKQPLTVELNNQKIPYQIDFASSSGYFISDPSLSSITSYELHPQMGTSPPSFLISFDPTEVIEIKRGFNTLILTGNRESPDYHHLYIEKISKRSSSVRFLNLIDSKQVREDCYVYGSNPAAASDYPADTCRLQIFSEEEPIKELPLVYSVASSPVKLQNIFYDFHLYLPGNHYSFKFYPEAGESYTVVFHFDGKDRIAVRAFVDNQPGDHYITPMISLSAENYNLRN